MRKTGIQKKSKSKRKRAKAASLESEALLANILDSASEAIIAHDEDQHILVFNAAAEKMFGYRADQVLGQPLQILLPQRFARDHNQYVRDFASAAEAARAMGARSMEIVGRRKDGTEFPAEIGISKTTRDGKSIFAAVVTDIGARRRAEQALRESEARYRDLFDNANDIVYTHDLAGNFTSVNRATEHITGYTREEALALNIAQVVAPEDLALAREMIQRKVDEGGPTTYELEIIAKDGHRVPLEVSTRLMYQNGKPVAVQGIGRDITERKRANEALRRQNEYLAAVQDTTFDLISQLDLNILLENIVKRAGQLVETSSGFLDLVEPGTNQLIPRIGVGALVESLKFQVRPGEGLAGLVWQTGQPLAIDDYDAWSGRIGNFAHKTIHSIIGVPLLSGSRVLGVLGLAHDAATNRTFGPEVVGLLSHFARLATIAIENARLFEQTQRDLALTHELYELSSEILSTSTLEETASAVTYRVVQATGAASAMINLLDARGNITLRIGAAANGTLPSEPLPRPNGTTMQVFRAGEPIVISGNDERSNLLSPRLVEMGIKALIGLPLQVGKRVLGVFFLRYAEPHFFSEEEIQTLRIYANQAATALEKVRLLEETSRRLTELEAVSRVSTALRVAQSLDEMLPLLMNETLAVLKMSAGNIWLYDPPSGRLISTVARGWVSKIVPPTQPREGIVGHVFSTGQVHLSDDVKRDPRLRESVRSQVPEGWASAAVPIRTGQEIVGVLFAAEPLPHRVTADQVHLMTTLAEIAGNAIHRTRLHGQTERRLSQVQSLHAIDMAINNAMDLRVTLNVVLEHATAQLQVDAACILSFNPHTQSLDYAAGRGFRVRGIEHSHLRPGEGPTGQAILDRRIICLSDFAAEGTAFARAQLLAGEGFVFYCTAPLIAKGQVKGVLEIFHRAPLAPDAEWFGLLETLAAQAALAIDNAGLFDELQRSNLELSLAYTTTLEGWSRALDLRDKETEGHTQRVSRMTLRLAREIGISEAELAHLQRGALLHDIGKMGIPDAILLKPGPLSEDEWEIMRRHPQIAYDLLSPIEYLHPALDIPYCHHEKWDGTGYPRRLKGEQIPIAARVFAVVDVWDALLSDRPYRLAWPEEKMREYLREQAGKHFDSRVVELFMDLITNERNADRAWARAEGQDRQVDA